MSKPSSKTAGPITLRVNAEQAERHGQQAWTYIEPNGSLIVCVYDPDIGTRIAHVPPRVVARAAANVKSRKRARRKP